MPLASGHRDSWGLARKGGAAKVAVIVISSPPVTKITEPSDHIDHRKQGYSFTKKRGKASEGRDSVSAPIPAS